MCHICKNVNEILEAVWIIELHSTGYMKKAFCTEESHVFLEWCFEQFMTIRSRTLILNSQHCAVIMFSFFFVVVCHCFLDKAFI